MHQQITTLRNEVVYDNNYRVVGSQIESFVEGSAEQVRVHVDQVIVLLMRNLEMDKHCHGDEKSSYCLPKIEEFDREISEVIIDQFSVWR